MPDAHDNSVPSQNDVPDPFVEPLGSAGLVALVSYDEDCYATRLLLSPNEAEVLADQLRVAAEEVRDA